MGSNLAPLLVKKRIDLEFLRGKRLAVDASNTLYQFLSVVRLDYGIPLRDPKGGATSHLGGLMFRSSRLLHDYGIDLVYVFDGKPPLLKAGEIQRRSAIRSEAERKWAEAVASGDQTEAFSKAVTSTRLTHPMIEDAKRLLRYMGIPYVEASGEAEAQAAHMVRKSRAWAVNSRDNDSLLFGARRLVRYITIAGTEYLPSKGVARRLTPELIELSALLTTLQLDQEQLIDLAILIGTDYNAKVKGIGPKKALRLMQKHRRLEDLPEDIRVQLPGNIEDIRKAFKEPPVVDDYSTDYGKLDEESLLSFLVEEKGFSPKRVEVIIDRMRSFHKSRMRRGIADWLT